MLRLGPPPLLRVWMTGAVLLSEGLLLHHILMSSVTSRNIAVVSIVLTVFAAVLVIKLLSINFNTESILQRTLKQFGPVASKK